MQQNRQTRTVQGQQPGDSSLFIQQRLDLLDSARAAGALVFPRLDLGLQRLNPRLQRPILVGELVDALAQSFIPGEAVRGRQRLASSVRRRRPAVVRR